MTLEPAPPALIPPSLPPPPPRLAGPVQKRLQRRPDGAGPLGGDPRC